MLNDQAVPEQSIRLRSDRVAILQRMPLFATLTAEQMAALAEKFKIGTFSQNTVLFGEGEPADRLWVVQDGQIKIVKYTAEGQENLLEVIMPGEMFGGAGILFPIHPATAVAMTDVTTLSLARDTFLQLLQQFPAVSLHIISLLGERLRAAMNMRALATERVDTRLAHILLKLADKIGTPGKGGMQIGMSLSRQDLADMTGTTIETAIRIMSKFRKEGLVQTERGGYIVILNRERLAALAEGGLEG